MTPFSASLPTHRIAWDSTSLGLLKECPRKYYYQMVLGYGTSSTNVHLRFGLLYHAALERYDHARAQAADHDQALDVMVEWALENSGERDELGTFTPWESGDDFKNRYTLIRSVVWYVEEYRKSHLSTVILDNGKPAVELSFKFEAFDVANESILLCGHIDKLVYESDNPDRIWVSDHKTTKSALSDHWYKSFTPHNQFTLYTIAGNVVLGADRCQGVIVNGAQIQIGFTRFGQRPAPRPKAVLGEWLSDAKWWITQARQMAEADHWPMNDKSCGNYSGCPFAKVCAVSPNHRNAWLKSDFVSFNWNPLVARGDV